MSHPDAILAHTKRNKILAVHSDTSYLTEQNVRSRTGGHFFLIRETEDPYSNKAVLNIVKIIRCVITSAAEA